MKASNQQMHPLFGLDPGDGIDQLILDHKRVAGLFAQVKRLKADNEERNLAALVQQICQELALHMQLEEEIFYPAAREVLDEGDAVDEAIVEHAGAKQLIAQLQSAKVGEALYDAKVTVLGEQIDHHVEEEEGSFFPKVRHAGLDAHEIGAQMRTRREQLKSDPISSMESPAAVAKNKKTEPPISTGRDAGTSRRSPSSKSAKRAAPRKHGGKKRRA